MVFINRLLVVLLLLAVMAFCILFSLENTTSVPLNILIAELPEQHVSIWVLGAFALGAITGLVISGISNMRVRTQNHMTSRKLKKTERELEAARSTSLSTTG